MRIMHFVLIGFFLIVAMTGSVKATPPTGAAWKQDSSRSDEFNGLSLDTNLWSSGPLFYSRTGAGWPFVPENGFVSDGKLNLRAAPGNPVTVSAVHSKFLVPGNSYLEVKAKCLPWAAHLLTAIWLQGPFEAQYNPNVEIDIQEVFDPRKITSNLHLWNVPNQHIADGVGHPVDVGADVTADYHLYGLERRPPGIVRIYFDDKLVWDAKPSNPPRYATQERELIFSLESHLGALNAAGLPAAALIDYVRLYTVATTKAFPSSFRKSREDDIRVSYLHNGTTSVAVHCSDYTVSVMRADGRIAWTTNNKKAAVYAFSRRTLNLGVYLIRIVTGSKTISKVMLIH